MAAKKSKIPRKSTTPAKPKVRKPMTKLDRITVGEINKCAEQVFGKIQKLDKPELKFPERSLKNAKYDKKVVTLEVTQQTGAGGGGAPDDGA